MEFEIQTPIPDVVNVSGRFRAEATSMLVCSKGELTPKYHLQWTALEVQASTKFQDLFRGHVSQSGKQKSY